MTLLAAIQRPGFVLFSGDGREEQQASTARPQGAVPTERVSKIMKTAIPSLMWGWAGGNNWGEYIEVWLHGRRFDSWDQLKEDVRKEFATKIRLTKEELREAGIAISDVGMRTDLVFAGYVRGNPGIWYLPSADCQWHEVSDTGVLFRGWAADEARLTWDVTEDLTGADDRWRSAPEFHRFMTSFVLHTARLYPPVETWIITSEGTSTVSAPG